MKEIEVVAAIIKKDNAIFAAQRGYGEFEGGWEFPGGKVEMGETLSEALSREIFEELNLEIQVQQHIVTVRHQYDSFKLTMHCYLCTTTSKDFALNEHKTVRWLSADELAEVNWLPADLPVVQAILDQHIL